MLTKLANTHLKKVIPYTPGISSDAVRRLGGVKNAIKLSSNESALGPSPAAIKAAQNAMHLVYRYPDSSCFLLRQTLSKFLKISPERLIFGNGSDELIVLAIRAFTNNKVEILTAKPTFLVYGIATKVHNAKLSEVPMLNYAYDLPSMKQKINKKTKLIFIANPDNPTGSHIPKNKLLRFIKTVPKNCIVFIDEAYHEYAHGCEGYDSCADLIRLPNVIVSRTFSKAYGLSGLRIGYSMANPMLIDAMNRVREPFNINSIAQVAAVAALKDQAFVKKVVRFNSVEKEKVMKFLRKLGCEPYPSVANFIMFKISDSETVAKELLTQGIIIRNLSGWGLKDCLRVTISTRAENKLFMKALETIVINMRKSR